MPDWQPNWADVDFDHAAAEEAARRCRTTALAIDTGRDATEPSHRDAVADWEGRLCGQYRARWGRLTGALAALRDDLLALAEAIEAGAEAARAEQARRERQRDRWRAQLRVELAAARHRAGELILG